MSHTLIHNPNLLKDRVILVTGASRGIGRVMAKGFAANGATVILLSRSTKKLETLYDEIEKAGYPQPAIYPFNLAEANPKAYEDLFNTLTTQFGKLDGLLHNAAMLGSLTPIEHYPITQWYEVLQVNLNSTFLLTKATLPLLKKSKEASVIFTTQTPKQTAKAYWGAYAISKFGLEGFMQILADELEVNTHIRVNSIDPKRSKTHLRREAYPAEDSNLNPEPSTLLPLYLYLMGPSSRGITGKNFSADEISL